MDIADLVCRFDWCFDRRHFAGLADMFTDDVVIDHLWGRRRGRQAVVALLRQWQHANLGVRHESTNTVVWADDPDTARAQSYLTERVVTGPAGGDGRAPALGPVVGHGLVTDRFRRGTDGIWRMSRRTVDQMYFTPGYLGDEDARRWFALSARQRHITTDRPEGWDPQPLDDAQTNRLSV
ncbi:hypothetical protein GCM10027167_71680 [Nocardia heshunensis]